MFRPRCIVTLLLKGRGLVKSTRFQTPTYVGDPINAVRIFNEKEADELMFLDILAGRKGIQYDLLKDIIQEALMPFSYGGGIRTMEDVHRVFDLGVEKIVFCSGIFKNPEVITQTVKEYGSQAVSVCMNVMGDRVLERGLSITVDNFSARQYAKWVQDLGAGEIIVQSTELDGTMGGYDVKLLKRVSRNVNIQVVALGGAGHMEDFEQALTMGEVSAVAAGSMFVFHGPFKSVLINYPSKASLRRLAELYPGNQ